MEINESAINLIKSFEGLELKAYPDPATNGEPYTIGYGTTVLPDGKKVKLGDVCTEQQAIQYLTSDLNKFANNVKPLIKSVVNDNQFGALVSFAYNIGYGQKGLGGSTLLKKVNANPADVTIVNQFMKWNKAAGKEMKGLTRRREAESRLYFTK